MLTQMLTQNAVEALLLLLKYLRKDPTALLSVVVALDVALYVESLRDTRNTSRESLERPGRLELRSPKDPDVAQHEEGRIV